MSEIPYFCFASFARTLQGKFMVRPSDTEIVNLLLEFVIVEGGVKKGQKVVGQSDEAYNIDSDKANKLMNRKVGLYSGLKLAARDPKVIDVSQGYFSRKVIPRIDPQQYDNVIQEIRELIQQDHIADTTEARLLDGADKEHLASFLSKTFLYSMGVENKNKEDGRRRRSSSSPSSGIVASDSSFLVLPEEKVDMIVKTVISRLFQLDQLPLLEDVKLQSFKNEEFHKVLQTLVSEGRMNYTELYKCNNFLQIAEKADEMLREQNESSEAGDEELEDYLDDPSDNPVSSEFDFDWMMRFYEACGNISSDEMQVLWAKILAGETKQPGSYSLRAMETLRNMSTKEARLLKAVSGMVMDGLDSNRILFMADSNWCYDAYAKFGIDTIHDLSLLVECGVLSLERDKGFSVPSPQAHDGYCGITIDNEYLLSINPRGDVPAPIMHNSYVLTSVGEELLGLSRDGINFEFFHEIAKRLDNEFTIELHRKLQTVMICGVPVIKWDYDRDVLTEMYGEDE